jgi:hypothetical protein
MDQGKVYPIPTVGMHRETTLNTDLDTNHEQQDCDIGAGWGGHLWERRRWR